MRVRAEDEVNPLLRPLPRVIEEELIVLEDDPRPTLLEERPLERPLVA